MMIENTKTDCRNPIVLCMAAFKYPVNNEYAWCCNNHEETCEDFPDRPSDYCKHCELKKIHEDLSVFVCMYQLPTDREAD